MAQTADEIAQAARNAVASGDWVTATALFETLVECEATPDALAGLGDTLWWLGRTDDAIRYQEQAYAAFRRGGDVANSAMAAVGLYLLYRVSLGNVAAARGWLGRAARLVEEAGLAPLAGWVALLRAHDSDDAVAAERWSREAREHASGFGDPDLELCAISQLGASLMQQGQLAEGTALLDEAMAASLAGECQRPHTVVYTSCNMISACAETAEFDHALQWIRAADGFTTRYGSPHLYVHCRVYYGAVLFASGDWAAAESELREAMAAAVSAEPALHAEASARFAELRLAQGRLEEAERLLEGLEGHTTSACVLAAIALARGHAAAARRIALRRVRELDQQDSARTGAHRAGLAVCLEVGRLAIRAGGHSAAGFSSVESGIVADLRAINHVRVDAERRVAAIGGGALAGQVDRATHPFGLATTTATVSTVGVAGFTLSGGISYLTRKHGLGVDNLLGADVVLADGSLARAGEGGGEDLLWALRGGGGNLGIVTELRMRLHPVSVVTGGPMLFPTERAERLVRLYRDWMPQQADDIYAFLALLTTPPTEPFPEAMRLRPARSTTAAPLPTPSAGIAPIRRMPPLAEGNAWNGRKWFPRSPLSGRRVRHPALPLRHRRSGGVKLEAA